MRRRGFEQRHQHRPHDWYWGDGPGGRHPSHWPRWKRRRQGVWFLRFATVFGILLTLVLGGMAAAAFLLANLAGADGSTALLVWFAGCGLALTLPLLAVALATWAFRGFARPLAELMAAADQVADGDLSVRIEEQGPGDIRRFSRSFNHMIEELALADERRRALTADVAHELRTPLHIIQGNLEGVLDGVYEADTEHIQATLDETRALSRLVEDLQTLSLAEAGQLPMAWEQVDVWELLLDVQTSFSGQADAAGILLEVKNDVADPNQNRTYPSLIIKGDYGRLNQVLTNLVANAMRYTEEGGAITLHAHQATESVNLTVTDSGQGILPEQLPYLFDRFWRADPARSHISGAHSGLGLAIAQQLVLAHGGDIQVQSTVGEGTTFEVRLPEDH
ncbi:MAG: HAMP domain-containing histidine kinase [Chloroflexi bacterium]|nr:HAMP domain-containing histidine kinase [Chloroflexota bacterium]